MIAGKACAALAGGKTARGMEFARQCCERGEPYGMYMLGWSLFHGEGIRQDVQAGLRLLQQAAKAAKAREEDAMYSLGVAHRTGHGVKKSVATAIAWFEAAAKRQHAGALYNLGVYRRDGVGMAVDYVKARRLFKRAGLGGEPDGWTELDVLCWNGEGGRVDRQRAVELWRKAKRAGSRRAARHLAETKAERRTRAVGVGRGAR